MIDDLDKSLEALLKQELPQNLREVSITFAAPGEDFPPSGTPPPAIDLFLYDVREDRDLRSNEWLLDRQPNGSATRRRSPIRIGCSYLVTAWPGTGMQNPAGDEHRLLGEVMKVLLRFPTLPSGILRGALKEQQPSMPTTTLQAGRLESLGEFWQAMGGRAKAALHYSVTFALEIFPPEVAGPPVLEKELRFHIPEKETTT